MMMCAAHFWGADMKYLIALPCLLAAPAFATVCAFETECFETDACGDSAFSLTIADDHMTIDTEFGSLDVVNRIYEGDQQSIFATGPGATYLLTSTPDGARLTTHMMDGPMTVSYIGTCEVSE